MVEVHQARGILIELAISAPLDHALLRQLIDVLPHDTEVRRQLYATHQHRACAAPLLPRFGFGRSGVAAATSVIASPLVSPFSTGICSTITISPPTHRPLLVLSQTGPLRLAGTGTRSPHPPPSSTVPCNRCHPLRRPRHPSTAPATLRAPHGIAPTRCEPSPLR